MHAHTRYSNMCSSVSCSVLQCVSQSVCTYSRQNACAHEVIRHLHSCSLLRTLLTHTLRHTAIRIAAHCNTHSSALLHTATHTGDSVAPFSEHCARTHCSTLQHPLQHTATHTALHHTLPHARCRTRACCITHNFMGKRGVGRRGLRSRTELGALLARKIVDTIHIPKIRGVQTVIRQKIRISGRGAGKITVVIVCSSKIVCEETTFR